MRILYVITVAVMFLSTAPFIAQAQSNQRDEEIIERLIRLETQIAAMNEKIEMQIAAMNEKIDMQMTAMNGKIDMQMTAVNGRIDDLGDVVCVTLGGIITLMCGFLAMMGYVMWDRRTAITPVVRKAKELEQGFEDEKVALRKVLKGYARVEPRFAEVVRTAGML